MGNPYEDVDGTHASTLSEAWRQAHELVTTGQITLQNEQKIIPGAPGAGDYVRAVWGLLHFKPPKKKLTTSADDFIPAKTGT